MRKRDYIPPLTSPVSPFWLLVEEVAAVPRRVLGRTVGTASNRRYEIVAAIDMLFTGI